MAFIAQATSTTVASNTETVVYDGTTNNSGNGAPTAGAVLIGLVAANIGSQYATVTIYKRSYLNSAGTGEVYTIKDAPLPIGSSLDALPAKMILNPGEIIYMKASVANTVQVTASLLEN